MPDSSSSELKTVYYGDYLRLGQLLSAQQPLSQSPSGPAHDEMLFIIIHQVYELWFKQILHELDSLLSLFSGDYVAEPNIGKAVLRIHRITEIQAVMIDQLKVLETMSAADFLDFRDALTPASGFQSLQFRLIENKLGLRPAQRQQFGQRGYRERLQHDDSSKAAESEAQLSLYERVELWLERTPFLMFADYDFWTSYEAAVQKMRTTDQERIMSNVSLTEDEKVRDIEAVNLAYEKFQSILNPEEHHALVSKGERRLSYQATKAALLIFLYQDQPILHLPFRFLTGLIEIDERFSTWRYRHFQMVHRMIGTKIGTGGSSGHHYLKQTVDAHRIFTDFFNLSTYLLPQSHRPQLPASVVRELGFMFSSHR